MKTYLIAWTWGGYTQVQAESEEQARENFYELPDSEIAPNDFEPDIVSVTEGEE